MSYKILPTRQFEKDIAKLDKNFKLRLKSKIEEVSKDPARYKHMDKKFAGSCRIRIDKLRVIFSYNVQKQELYPEKIVFGHKY